MRLIAREGLYRDGAVCSPPRAGQAGVCASAFSHASRSCLACSPHCCSQSEKTGAKDSCLAPLLGRLLSCCSLIHFLLFATPQLPSDGGGRLPFGRDRESSSSSAGVPPFSPSHCGPLGSGQPSASLSPRLSCRVPLCADRSDGCSSNGVSQLLVMLMLEQRRAKEVQRLETATGTKALTVCASNFSSRVVYIRFSTRLYCPRR